MSPSVAVRLLGPVRVTCDDAVVDLGGPKQLTVAAVLALAAGRPRSPVDLAAALWGDDVPPSGPGTLRAYVSRMRSHLPDDAIDRSAAGWTLAVERAAVDALHMEDLVVAAERAGTAERRALLEQALALWQGEPLAGLGDLPFAVAERSRLAELRAGAAEALLELRLAAGEEREVIREASALAEELPYREGPVRVLATALARSGRHADALAAVERLRGRLVEDLGLDPSPTMADLHRRLLLHDPAVVQPVAGRAPGADGAVVRPGAPHADGESVPRPPLPLPLTSFVGREDDIAAVHAALGVARLVTLVGPGGAGKTRLALEALRRLAPSEQDGPWVVELGYVTDPGQVVETVAQALGVTTTGAGDVAAVADAIRGRSILLLLDNCEHVVDQAAALVAHLLTACGGLQVLATSREVLGVAGERVHVVEPLAPGRPGAPGEAELLFAERAASVVPGFRLDGTTAAAVSRLVRALDGIPLAVELAAARLAVMGLDDMLAMLGDRFALLEGGARTALPHQRTLGAAVAWSYDLLDQDERRLFGVAGTFAGPFTLPALRGLAGDEGRPVIGLLASLTAKSMVQVDRSGDPRESRTYRLLETMRVFARDRTDPAERGTLAARHAAWFAAEAVEAFSGLRGPDAKRWLAHLDLVRPDMRAALRYAVDHEDRTLAQQLVGGLATSWFHRGHLREGLAWVAAAGALPGRADPVAESRAALGAAQLAYGTGDATALDPTVLAALAEASESEEDAGSAAVASVYGGYFQAAFGRLDLAQGYFVRAAELVQGGRVEPWALSEVLFAQGQLLRAQDNRAEALEVLRQAGQVGQACGHVWAAGSARYIAAKVHIDLRQGAPALVLVAQTLPSTLDLGILTSTLALLHVASGAAALVERHAEGATLLGAVDTWGERIGYHPSKMDPVDAAAHRALVRAGLETAEYEAAWRRGRGLTLAEASERVLALAERAGRRTPVRA